MPQAYIVAARRTAIGSFLGRLKNFTPSKLQSIVIKDILQQQKISSDLIEEVIVGNVLSAGQGQGIGRQAVIDSGLPEEVGGYSINMMCGSGMKAIMLAESEIRAGRFSIIIAGGAESMSMAPHLIPAKNLRQGKKLGDFSTLDHILHDGLTDAFHHYHMGITAENIASKYGISRKEQDLFALDSQRKTLEAITKNTFKNEITPIPIKDKKNPIFAQDEYPNPQTTLEKLTELKPVFLENGTVTAGNASGINDGASALLITSKEALEYNHLTPLVKIVGSCELGLDPRMMGLGPALAIKKLLEKTAMKFSDIDLLELNEAFAAQSIGVLKELEKFTETSYKEILLKTNVNGGAIALGHPIGCSGNRIVVSLIHEMKRRKASYGIASLCIGGGMGTAILLENSTSY